MKPVSCWKCGTILNEIENNISFRAVCDRCLSALHCCRNCQFYSPGRANDCAIPGTEFISDRMSNNFCEEFRFLKNPSSSNSNKETKKFDDLFK